MIRDKLYNNFVESLFNPGTKRKCEERFEEFYKDFLDLNKKAILPLSIIETYILREDFGIEVSGTKHTPGFDKRQKINTYIAMRIHNYGKDIEECNMLTSFDYYPERSEMKNTPLGMIDLPTEIFEDLRERKIYTLDQLLSYSTIKLRRMLIDINKYDNKFAVLYNKIRGMGFCFIDEINLNDRREIINSENDLEKLYNSSIDWIGFNHDDEALLATLGVYTIGGLKELIENDSVISPSIIYSYKLMVDENCKTK